MNCQRPVRRDPSRAHFKCACVMALACASLLFIPLVTCAQDGDAAEAARQEKARKAAQPRKQAPHVYTNDDLQRSQILTPEDRAPLEARKKNSVPPVINDALPSNAAADGASAPESLGEVARRVRQEKAARQAEQAGKLPPPTPFHLELPQAETFAHPKPLARPLVAPLPPRSKSVSPSIAAGSRKRDPFSRAIISAPHNSIAASAPAMKSAVPLAKIPAAVVPPLSPVLQPTAVAPSVSPVLSAPVHSTSAIDTKARPDTVRVQTGDSLWNLSRQYLGKGNRWQEWLSRNPTIGDPRRMQPGSVLLVPLAAPHADIRDGPPSGAPNSGLGTISVQSGDSLWRIAAKQFGRGTDWPCLAQANPDLRDVDRIYPGQTLQIPGACPATGHSSVARPLPHPAGN